MLLSAQQVQPKMLLLSISIALTWYSKSSSSFVDTREMNWVTLQGRQSIQVVANGIHIYICNVTFINFCWIQKGHCGVWNSTKTTSNQKRQKWEYLNNRINKLKSTSWISHSCSNLETGLKQLSTLELVKSTYKNLLAMHYIEWLSTWES